MASRMCRAFARDRGFGHASPVLERVSRRLKVPVWSLIFVSIWVVIFGLICEQNTRIATGRGVLNSFGPGQTSGRQQR